MTAKLNISNKVIITFSFGFYDALRGERAELKSGTDVFLVKDKLVRSESVVIEDENGHEYAIPKEYATTNYFAKV